VASVTLDQKLPAHNFHLGYDRGANGKSRIWPPLSSNPNLPGWKSRTSYNTMDAVTKLIGAQDLWARNTTGGGIGIALIRLRNGPRLTDSPDKSWKVQTFRLSRNRPIC